MDKEIEVFMEDIIAKNPGEKEFHQAVREVTESIMPYINKNPKFSCKKERSIVFTSKSFSHQ